MALSRNVIAAEIFLLRRIISQTKRKELINMAEHIPSPADSPAVKFAMGELPEDTKIHIRLVYDPAIPSQGYMRTMLSDGCTISASDDAGLMYGILDVAESLKNGTPMCDTSVSPYLKNRGIKFNIPLDSRTPSYSDASTSAAYNIPVMWEESFWHSLIDQMARDKFNVLSLWTLSPFPSLVRIPEYPDASLDDVKVTTKPFHADLSGRRMYCSDHAKSFITVKHMTIDEKITFWRGIMEYAANRCVRIFIFTWNIFVYGTENSGYGITDSMDNPVTRDYIRCGTKALMETYPLLAGIGVTSGENMGFRDNEACDRDAEYIADTYGRAVSEYAIKHPERDFTLIQRMQMTRYDQIMNHYSDFHGKLEISFKYSQAHMYSSTKPQFITNFLQEKHPDTKVWLTVRNDDYYMLRWGDPDFAREYLLNMPVECMSGFYMGSDGFTWGRDFMTRDDTQHVLFTEKMWFMMSVWGKLSYQPSVENSNFTGEAARRFHISATDSEKLCRIWADASRLLPTFQRTHWHDFDFQWYPEGCCMYVQADDKIVFADINEFVECPSMPGENCLSVMEFARLTAAGERSSAVTPLEAADEMLSAVRRIENALPELYNIDGDSEYSATVDDIKAMALMGKYFALKEQAAVHLAIYRCTKVPEEQQLSISLLKKAAHVWKEYSAHIASNYIPQVLTRLCGRVDLQTFDALADGDIALAMEG